VRAELRGSGVEIACVMPTVVNTELTAGVGQRLIRPVEASDVANEIVDALEAPRFDVWVPRANGIFFKVIANLPRGAREGLGRLMKVDKLMTEVDHGARHAYETRAAASRGEDSDSTEAEKPSTEREAA
ncbi:MAG: short-chain dehydrogenase, partial [Solirubrobacterales bacterium]